MGKKKKKIKNNNSSGSAVIYPYSAYQKDEKMFNHAVKNGSDMDWDGFKRLMIRDICSNSKVLDAGYICDVRLEDAQTALQNPKQGWRVLMNISEKLMHAILF